MVIHGNESGTYKALPPKLKFLLSHHLATNSFGLGRLFYKLLGAMTKMVATCRAAKENKT